MAEHAVPVLAGEVDLVQGDFERVGDTPRLFEVFGRGTVLGIVVIVPVLHEQAFDAMTLFEQTQGGDGRVDAAG